VIDLECPRVVIRGEGDETTVEGSSETAEFVGDLFYLGGRESLAGALS
jgi:hypothetical protein